MGLLDRQSSVTPQRGMPVETRSGSSTIQAITGETVQFYYSNAGVRTIDAGQAAGTPVVGVLANRPVMNSNGTMQATEVDTSLTFTSTAFTSEVPFPENVQGQDHTSWASRLASAVVGLTAGQYCVDYAHGIIYGVKASTQVTLTSTAYSVLQETTDVSFSSGATVAPTPGTTWTRTTIVPSAASQILIAANTSRKGLRIVFNQVTLQTLYFSPGTASASSYFTSQVGSGELELWDTSNPYTGVWNVIGTFADGTIQVWELT